MVCCSMSSRSPNDVSGAGATVTQPIQRLHLWIHGVPVFQAEKAPGAEEDHEFAGALGIQGDPRLHRDRLRIAIRILR